MKKQTYESIIQKTGDKIMEWKICKQCTAEFPITQKENDLIEKISPVVAEKKQSFDTPELCPDCRARHRLVRRNEWNFYNSKSAMTGKKLFSLLPPNSEMPVVSLEEFWTDEFNGSLADQDIDMGSSILKQFGVLRSKIPTQSTMTIDNQNCHYTTGTGYCKNCYLINSSENSEDCMYGKLFQTCKNCLDCSYIYDSEKLYQCINVKNGYNSMWLNNSQDSSFCYFSDDLIACQNCMFCSGLRNAQYYFKNKQLTKQEREEKTKDYLGTRENIQSGLKTFQKLKINKAYKYANITNSENSYGDFQTDNKNCVYCYDTNGSENCMYANVLVETDNVVDVSNTYLSEGKAYNCLGIMHVYDVHLCVYVFDSNNLILCQECHDSSFLFGCIGLKNKQYCIFNKQYTKQEYEKLVPQLINKMRSEKERHFFDPSQTHYPYNDSLAMEYFPIKETKNKQTGEIKIVDKNGQGTVVISNSEKEISDAILDLGGEYKMPIKWKTKEREINIPSGIEIYQATESDSLSENEILNSAFTCEESGRLFRVLKQELEFYKNMGLPLPSVHPDIRYKNRLKQKPNRELYNAKCSKCNDDLVTVHNRENQKVVCESCYNKSIY